jgi:hypothetical protein
MRLPRGLPDLVGPVPLVLVAAGPASHGVLASHSSSKRATARSASFDVEDFEVVNAVAVGQPDNDENVFERAAAVGDHSELRVVATRPWRFQTSVWNGSVCISHPELASQTRFFSFSTA